MMDTRDGVMHDDCMARKPISWADVTEKVGRRTISPSDLHDMVGTHPVTHLCCRNWNELWNTNLLGVRWWIHHLEVQSAGVDSGAERRAVSRSYSPLTKGSRSRSGAGRHGLAACAAPPRHQHRSMPAAQHNARRSLRNP